MVCPKCGFNNQDGIPVCSQCGNTLSNNNTPTPVQSSYAAVVPQQVSTPDTVQPMNNQIVEPTPVNNPPTQPQPVYNYDSNNIVIPNDFKFSDDAEVVEDAIPKVNNSKVNQNKVAPKKNKRFKKRKIKKWIIRILVIAAIAFVGYYVYVNGTLPIDFIKDFFFD